MNVVANTKAASDIGTGIAMPASQTRGARAVASAICAALLGLLLLYAVGFTHLQAIHDAAHDSRHAMTFPCH